MSALASFVSAARHGSFSRAGEEVGLTQSAISRQIAVLEEWLQVELFRRNGRRVELSIEGDVYAKAVGPALERIREASSALLDQRPVGELNIATLPSFGMRWLAPRLRALTSRHPDIVVNFAARSFPFRFDEEAFDAAIHFGAPDWPGGNHDRLFEEEAVPVCAPSLLEAHPIRDVGDVSRLPLLVQTSRRDAWTKWLRAAGIEAPRATPSASFEHFLMLAQAAAAGAGLALVPRFLIEQELREGVLVRPPVLPSSRGGSYHLVTPLGRPLSPTLQIFREWLLSEARIFDEGLEGARGPQLASL